MSNPRTEVITSSTWKTLGLGIMLLLSACATYPPSDTPSGGIIESENQAVLSLLQRARAHALNGLYNEAEAKLERALRIEPANPYLWYEFAFLELEQGNSRQAENLALRASGFAGGDRRLRKTIWQLIAEARSLHDDRQGAQEALKKARAY